MKAKNHEIFSATTQRLICQMPNKALHNQLSKSSFLNIHNVDRSSNVASLNQACFNKRHNTNFPSFQLLKTCVSTKAQFCENSNGGRENGGFQKNTMPRTAEDQILVSSDVQRFNIGPPARVK
jgi:hypothetical protein